MMMNKPLFFIGVLLSLGTMCACSDSDKDDLVSESDIILAGVANPSDTQTIIGKWKLVRYGAFSEISPETEQRTYVEFCENGVVRIERGVGTDDYKLIESSLRFENDWVSTSENGRITKRSGHVLFMFWGRGMNLDEPNRFLCWIENDTMWLLPDEGCAYVIDPTMEFRRVK